MLEGYKPLDFSSFLPSVGLDQIAQSRNKVGLSSVAQQILANASWDETPINLPNINNDMPSGKPEAPPHEHSPWARFVDLLSIGNYTVANALDESIAGHQSDPNDSVLSDIGQTIGGLATGGSKGLWASLRGTFGTDEYASDPTDKTRFGDVGLRLVTGMAADDAANPENWDKIKPLLEEVNDKSWYNKSLPEMLVPDNLASDNAQQDLVRNIQLGGIGHDIVLDPTNLIPGKAFVGGTVRGADEIIQAADDPLKGLGKTLPKTEGVRNTIPSVGKSVNPSQLGWGKKSGQSYKVSLPKSYVQGQVATGDKLTRVPEWFDFPASPASMGTERITESLVNTGGREPMDIILESMTKTSSNATNKPITAPKVSKDASKAIKKLNQPHSAQRLVSQLLESAAKGDADWSTKASTVLSNRFPGVQFENLTKAIQHFGKQQNFTKALQTPQHRNRIIQAFSGALRADIETLARPVKPASEIVNEAITKGSMPIRMEALTGPGKLSANQQGLAQQTIEKFSDQIIGKGRPTGIKNPGAYDASVASGKTVKYSGPQQAQMWNYVTSNSKPLARSPKKFNNAAKTLQQVEEHFIAKGAIPMSNIRTADSVPLRLSQVLQAIGPHAATLNKNLITKILAGDTKALDSLPTEAVQRIEALKAGEALADAGPVIQSIESTKTALEDLVKSPLSAARLERTTTIASRAAEDVARISGASPVGASKAAQFIRNEAFPKTPVEKAITNNKINTKTLISHPDVSGKLLAKYSNAPAVTKAIHAEIGGPKLAELGKMWGPSAKAIDWIGARFNTAYKNPNMRRSYLRQAATAKSSVGLRAQYLNNLTKKYSVNDKTLWADAFKGAQGVIPPVAGSKAEELSQEILKVMENLFGSSGLKEGAALENAVAGRAQLFMKELNQNMYRFGLKGFQFTNKGDYSEGVKWLNSWESWKIDDPVSFLFKIQNVVEHTVREKHMFDEIIGRFGTRQRAAGFTHTVNHPRLAGVYFSEETARQANIFVRNLKDISQPSSKQLQNYDKVLSKWKAAVTIYWPSHHIRNMMGDTFFNWVAGVNSVKPYNIALKVMRAQRGRYQGIDEISELTSPDALKKLMAGGSSSPVGERVAFTMKNGQKVTNDMVYTSAFQQGILPTTRVLEDIPDDVATKIDKFRPLKGKGQRAAHSISEGQNHYIRLAQYIDILRKSNKGFEATVETAANTVRKWHPDGMDLTSFEKNVLRRIFPFYSWTRKAFPLIAESAVINHQKVLAYPRAQYAGQLMIGDVTPAQDISDPFPVDQLFPEWLREKGTGPLFGEPGEYDIVNPSLPPQDLIASFSDPGKGALNMLTPAAKIPYELGTGRETLTGAPIEGYTDTDYISKQIPGVSHVGRATGLYGVSDTQKEQGHPNWRNILNMLTAAGYTPTGPYQKSAEFDLREYLRRNQ